MRFFHFSPLVNVVLLVAAPACWGDEVDELINGAIDRTTVITSGRLEWTCNSSRSPGPYEFVFSGHRWRMRALPPAGSGKAVFFAEGNILVETLLSGQPGNLKVDRYRLTKMAPGRSRENYLPGYNYKPPLYAGTVHGFLILPLSSASKHFQVVDTANINGVETTVCDGPMSPPTNTMHRLFIAPELGYVAPAIHRVTTDGRVVRRWDAFDFTEVAPGIFLPGRITEDTAKKGQAALDLNDCFHTEFTIKADRINTILVEQIDVEIPAGARVVDRAGRMSIELNRSATPKEAWDRMQRETLRN